MFVIIPFFQTIVDGQLVHITLRIDKNHLLVQYVQTCAHPIFSVFMQF